MSNNNQPPRVLCLDGGGTRGLISLALLQKLEEREGKPIQEMFDFICGTSTGGIIALALLKGYTVLQIKELYEKLASKVFGSKWFDGQWWRYVSTGLTAYYDEQVLEGLLKEYFGEEIMPTYDVETKLRVFVVCTEVTDTAHKEYLFRNYEVTTSNLSVSGVSPAPAFNGVYKEKYWVAARSTSAAPTFFKSYTYDGRTLVDGGLLANNPTEVALHECKAIWPNIGPGLILSVGTSLRPTEVTPTLSIRGWGKVLSQIATNTRRTNKNVRRWLAYCNRGGYFAATRLYRWDPPGGKHDLDVSAIATLHLFWQNGTDYFNNNAQADLQDVQRLINRQ